MMRPTSSASQPTPVLTDFDLEVLEEAANVVEGFHSEIQHRIENRGGGQAGSIWVNAYREYAVKVERTSANLEDTIERVRQILAAAA
jgi:hypothetical protein